METGQGGRWPPMVGEKIRGRGGSFGQKSMLSEEEEEE